jgi:hypothetical protein
MAIVVQETASLQCHQSPIIHIEHGHQGKLLLTSSWGMSQTQESALWKYDEALERKSVLWIFFFFFFCDGFYVLCKLNYFLSKHHQYKHVASQCCGFFLLSLLGPLVLFQV